MSERQTRRDLLGNGGRIAAAGLGVSAFQQPGRAAAALPVMGLIGCGGMGRANMDNFLRKGVPFAAVCDVDAAHARAAADQVMQRSGKRPEIYADFRKLLERKDVEAVVIATPDHWHALPAIYAAEAGKDMYLEKPISHNIVEGRAMVAAAKKSRRIVQVGTWQRSTREFVDAVDYVRSGKLGRITTVRAWKTDGSRMGMNPPKPPPAELDWDAWIGPAEMVPYTGKNGHGDWRWYWNFAAGMTGDWGVHMMDIALLAMSPGTDLVMPTEVSAYGGKLAWPEDDRTTPDTHVALFKFPTFVMHWETGRKPVDGPDGPRNNCTQFIAANGSSVTVWRGGWTVRSANGEELDPTTAPGFDGRYDHWQNFLDCVVSREQPRSPLESMYQTTTVCHLANIAYLAGASVRWDKAKNDIIGRTGKDQLPYRREYRKPWSLPKAE